MNEQDWSKCDDPTQMLEFLSNTGRATARKLRLFGCGCCQRFMQALEDERSKNGILVAELFADGLATDEQRKIASHGARLAWDAALDKMIPPVDSPEGQAAFQAAIKAGRFWVWDVEVAAGIVGDFLHENAFIAAVDVAGP